MFMTPARSSASWVAPPRQGCRPHVQHCCKGLVCRPRPVLEGAQRHHLHACGGWAVSGRAGCLLASKNRAHARGGSATSSPRRRVAWQWFVGGAGRVSPGAQRAPGSASARWRSRSSVRRRPARPLPSTPSLAPHPIQSLCSTSGVSHPNPQADHLCIGRGVVNARAGLLLRSPKTSPHSGPRGYSVSCLIRQRKKERNTCTCVIFHHLLSLYERRRGELESAALLYQW